MTDLRIEVAKGDAALEQWRHVHNVIVPPAAFELAEVRERSRSNRLENAYLGDVLVGCSTVRPLRAEDAAVTVIARVLPAYRRRGFGTALYENGLAYAQTLGAKIIETVVLARNEDGLRFAVSHGFAEVERYVLEPGGPEWVTLQHTPA